MFFKKLLPLVAACLLLAGDAFAAAPLRMSTVWLDEHETFLIWYAKQRGWDKEAGLDVNVRPFGSGIDVLNALPAEAWDMAGLGAVPALMLNLRHDARIVAVGNDEAAANAVLVRPDGPIAKASGVPGLLGDAADHDLVRHGVDGELSRDVVVVRERHGLRKTVVLRGLVRVTSQYYVISH